MKTSIAAMVVAVEEFVARASATTPARSRFLITSDEEGPAVDGTVQRRARRCSARGERLDYCIVGEPTSVRRARRHDQERPPRHRCRAGYACSGVQGHIAYPHLARNPIHQLAPALAELAAIEWDRGNAYFPPTSWQVSNIHAGTGAGNVIPGELVVDFNFRFSHRVDARVAEGSACDAVLDRHGLDYDARLDARRRAVPHAGRRAERGARARRSAPRPASRRSCRPPAAPPTAASSRRSARRWSSSARSTRASTRSTSTSRWRASSR